MDFSCIIQATRITILQPFIFTFRCTIFGKSPLGASTLLGSDVFLTVALGGLQVGQVKEVITNCIGWLIFTTSQKFWEQWLKRTFGNLSFGHIFWRVLCPCSFGAAIESGQSTSIKKNQHHRQNGGLWRESFEFQFILVDSKRLTRINVKHRIRCIYYPYIHI